MILRHTHDQNHPPVGCENNDGRQRGLQGAVQVGEALDVQHVDLVDEQDTRDQLSDTWFYVCGCVCCVLFRCLGGISLGSAAACR